MSSTSLLSSAIPTTATTIKSKRHRRHFTIKMSLNNPPPKNQNPNPNPNPNLLNSITKLLWGKSLPPQLLISTVRSTWSTTWHLMMSQLAPSDPSGGYTRPTSQFRANPNSPQFSRQNPGTLHLYVGLPCPWAHRTLIVRALKGLEDAVPVSIATPGMDGSWEFKDTTVPDPDRLVSGPDSANGRKTLREVYKLRRDGYDGRSTVPMLWDSERKEVVCNESYDIIEVFNSGLNGLARNSDLDLSPPSLKKEIDEWNRIIYPSINNGVYRCGFAQSQEAYDTAVNGLFGRLDMLDDHLSGSRYLCGETMTLADICLFTTLIRFDIVYNVLFKCTKKKLVEYPNLHGFMRDIYQEIVAFKGIPRPHLSNVHLLNSYFETPKVAGTCNLKAIMDGYYKILFPLNPGDIRPAMPSACEHEVLSEPHKRESLALGEKVLQVFVS